MKILLLIGFAVLVTLITTLLAIRLIIGGALKSVSDKFIPRKK